MNKRNVYYVISCTSEENQKGVFHYSDPYESLDAARIYGLKRREYLGNGEGHVSIEFHREVYEHNDWHTFSFGHIEYI